jgi:hypothetical protein
VSKKAKKGMSAGHPSARERTERETGTGKYVRKRSGTRTIYLHTVDWTVCSHYEEKVEKVVRGVRVKGEVSAEMCV